MKKHPSRKEKPPKTALKTMSLYGSSKGGSGWPLIIFVWILCLLTLFMIWST